MTNTWQMSPTTGSPVLVRLGAVALAVSGWLFLLYPVVRPWRNESTVGGAVASMSSDAWVAAHLFAVFALIVMPLGLLGLCRQLAGSRGYGLVLTGTVAVWLGAGLALPYYGAEDFALHALARQVRSGTSLPGPTRRCGPIRCRGNRHICRRPAAPRGGWRTDRHLDLAYGGTAAV